MATILLYSLLASVGPGAEKELGWKWFLALVLSDRWARGCRELEWPRLLDNSVFFLSSCPQGLSVW